MWHRVTALNEGARTCNQGLVLGACALRQLGEECVTDGL